MPAWLSIRSIADIEALEETPIEDRGWDKTVYELVLGGAALDPGKAAFLNLPTGNPMEEAVPTSYGAFLTQVHQAANLFNSLGVGKNDVVAIMLPIVPENFVAMIGAATAGILCPVNWMLERSQISAILDAVEAKVLVAQAPADGYDIWEKAARLGDQVDSLAHILQVALPGYPAEPERDFAALLRDHQGARLNFTPPATPDDTAIFAHTGGTTGMPKIARLRHRAIAYKCWAYSVLLETKPEHVQFAGSPLFHIGGMVYHTINTLAHGATSLVLGPMGFRNKQIIENYWHLVERYGVTDFFGVPTTLSALAGVAPQKADISSLRPYAMIGSTGLPVEISRYFEKEIGVRILSNYGMTENTATIALPPRDGDPRFGSSGFRLPYTGIRIVELNEQGKIARDCANDEIGNILIKGPGVIPGYLDQGFNEELFTDDGWLVTGDLGRLDAEHYLWVTGRAKDLIIRSGHNIDPLIIEEGLMGHPDVALIGAVGRPDSRTGEMPVAFVQLKPGRRVGADELRDFAAARIPERAAVPAEIIIVDELPLTAVGKIFKPDLRKMAAISAFTKLLAPLGELAGGYTIKLEDDAKHGSICRISITRADSGTPARAEEFVSRIMRDFTITHEIEWRPAQTASPPDHGTGGLPLKRRD